MFGFGGRNKQSNDQDPLSLEHHARVIHRLLEQLGLNPEETRMKMADGYGWSFLKGSALIEIYLSQQGAEGFLQVLSPIMHIPTYNTLPLYRRLLEQNLSMTSAALGLHNDVVYVFYERPIKGLDAHETDDIISKVARYADELDNQLVDEFGGRLYMQP